MSPSSVSDLGVSTNGHTSKANTSQLLRVGIIGAGEVAQCVHLPTLGLLSHLFAVSAICDVSPSAVAHCALKFRIPETYADVASLCASPNVDVVFVLTSDEFHSVNAITALEHDKHVLVEKPVSISLAAARRLREAESKSKGHVFVAYMRRYAPALQAFKQELNSIRSSIRYARVRDIIGPNGFFVSQSGFFPKSSSDVPSAAAEERASLAETLLREVYPAHEEITPLMTRFCRFLGGLGSHDLSVMRDVLGMPSRCTNVSTHPPFFTATFEYDSQENSGTGFAVTYESGIDMVPRFDAHLQVYALDKTLKLEYDTPYIKGLPVKVTVDEKVEGPEPGLSSYQQRELLATYEDPYTLELKTLYNCLVHGREIKTTVSDAIEDLEIFQMILKQAFPAFSAPKASQEAGI